MSAASPVRKAPLALPARAETMGCKACRVQLDRGVRKVNADPMDWPGGTAGMVQPAASAGATFRVIIEIG